MLSNKKMVVLICLISSIGRFAIDSYLPSVPAISKHFGETLAATQFTLTLYLFGFSISQLIYGPLSDHYGRRAIMIMGMVIFIIGSIGCVFATSHHMLLAARLIAGMGAGACGVLNRAIASDCFQGPEFSKAWSYTTSTLVLTLCLAPIFGGAAEQIYGWRANFAMSAGYVLLVLWLIIKYLPETHQALRNNQEIGHFKYKDVFKNYYRLLSEPTFVAGTMCYTLSFAGVIAYFQMSPIIFIDTCGLTPVQYGWCSLVIAANYLLGGYIVNKYVALYGVEKLLRIGTVLLLAGGVSLLLIFMNHIDDIRGILCAASIYILGARIIIPNAIATSLKGMRHLGGSCSALIGCIQMLGSSLVSMLLASLMQPPLLMLAIVFILLGATTWMISSWLVEPILEKNPTLSSA